MIKYKIYAKIIKEIEADSLEEAKEKLRNKIKTDGHYDVYYDVHLSKESDKIIEETLCIGSNKHSLKRNKDGTISCEVCNLDLKEKIK